jgi:hypothetical protein
MNRQKLDVPSAFFNLTLSLSSSVRFDILRLRAVCVCVCGRIIVLDCISFDESKVKTTNDEFSETKQNKTRQDKTKESKAPEN